MTDTKRCPDCGKDLPRTPEHWPRNRSRPDGLSAYCFPCHRARARDAYDRRMERPGERLAYAQRQRENHRLRRDPNINAPLRKSQTTAIGAFSAPPGANHVAPILAAQPLAEWMRWEFSAWAVEDVATMAGVDCETIRRLLNGKYRRVSLYVADLIFTRAGCPHLLALLYPLGDEPALPPRRRKIQVQAV